jgi:transketolase
VIGTYSIKPLDAETVRAAARECGAVVTVEDHTPEGGLADAVLEALAGGRDLAPVVRLAVRELPGSGTPAELLRGAGIDAGSVANAARELVRVASP